MSSTMHDFDYQVNNSEPGKLLVHYNPKCDHVEVYWQCPLRPQLLIDGVQCTLNVVKVGTCPMKHFINYYDLVGEISIKEYEKPVFFYIGLDSATSVKVTCHGDALDSGYKSDLSHVFDYITQAISFLEDNLKSGNGLNAVDTNFNQLISSLSSGYFPHNVTRENSFNNLILVYLNKYARGCIDKKNIHILLICLSVIKRRANDLIDNQKKISEFDPYKLDITTIPIKTPKVPQNPKIMPFVGVRIGQGSEETSRQEAVMEKLKAPVRRDEQPTQKALEQAPQAPQAIVTLGDSGNQRREVLAIEAAPARVPAQRAQVEQASYMAGGSSRFGMDWQPTGNSQTYTPMSRYTPQPPQFNLTPAIDRPGHTLPPPPLPSMSGVNGATTPTRSSGYFGGPHRNGFILPPLPIPGANSATTPILPSIGSDGRLSNEFTPLPPLNLRDPAPTGTIFTSQQDGLSPGGQTRAPEAVMSVGQITPGSNNSWFGRNNNNANTNTDNSPVIQSPQSHGRQAGETPDDHRSWAAQDRQEIIVVSTSPERPAFARERKAASVAGRKVSRTLEEDQNGNYGDVDMSETHVNSDDENDEDYEKGDSDLSGDEAPDEDVDSDDMPLATRVRRMNTGSTRATRGESVSGNTRQSARDTPVHTRGIAVPVRARARGRGGRGRNDRRQEPLPSGLRRTTTHHENIGSSSSPSGNNSIRGRLAKRSKGGHFN